jgi:hypothetical protein
MQILTPKFRRNPNEMVSAIYAGVAPGNRTVTTIRKRHPVEDRMESTRVYGPALPRGQGGRVAVLVLGGMETTLDGMEYIVAAKQSQKFVPQRGASEISQMCRLLADRRNEAIMEARKRAPAAPPKPKRKVRLHLPVGFRYAPTGVPGLKVLARI